MTINIGMMMGYMHKKPSLCKAILTSAALWKGNRVIEVQRIDLNAIAI